MDTKVIETYVENYINDKSSGSIPELSGENSAIDRFRHNTAKRLIICFDKYKAGIVSKDVFLCSLRNYLLVFQNEIFISEGMISSDNEYGIIKNTYGKRYSL